MNKIFKEIGGYLIDAPLRTKLEDAHTLFLIAPGIISSVCYALYYRKELRSGQLSLGENTLSFEWKHNGLHHRENGPAIIDFLFLERKYYYNGNQIDVDTTVDFQKKIKMKAFW